MATALITGASAGLGKDFADIFAKEGYDLVLVARSKDKLDAIAKELEKKYSKKVTVIAKDLSKPSAAKELWKLINDQKLEINCLVNNAGFGSNGPFLESTFEKESEMIQLNVNFLAELTYLVAGKMKERKSGEILNVASTAAFQPGPFMSNYYATKAYVLSFSEGIAEELSSFGITVSVLCPGPTYTDFFTNADMKDSNLAKNSFLIMKSYPVARMGFDALKAKKTIKIAGFFNFLLAQSTRFSPRFLIRKIAKMLNQ
jgi:short-subunit dehydrogenase